MGAGCRPGLGLAAVLLVLGLGTEVALAQERARPVHVQVLIALADPQYDSDDPDCAPIRRELGPVDVGHLRLVDRRMLQLGFGEHGAIILPIGSEVRLMPINVHQHRLHMQLVMPGRMNTRLQMLEGKPVIVGGPRMQHGHLLVRITSEFPSTGTTPEAPPD